MDGLQLTFQPEALEAIVEKSKGKKMGARGLRSILERHMLQIMYEIPALKGEISEVIITPEVVFEGADPKIIPRSKDNGAENS